MKTSVIAQNKLKFVNLPEMRGMRASVANPFDPSGPLGARMVVRRGADSSMELILMREIKRSGRGDESWILTTPQAEVFPVRWRKFNLTSELFQYFTQTYMVCNDGELHCIAGVQAVAAALNFCHVEKQFLPFIDLVIQEAKLSLDGIDNSAFLVTYSGNLQQLKI